MRLNSNLVGETPASFQSNFIYLFQLLQIGLIAGSKKKKIIFNKMTTEKMGNSR
jgi:hypothetical protein